MKLCLATALIGGTFASIGSAQTTSWVKSGASGRLIYGTDSSGDRIGDFSRAGYAGGDAALPTVANLGLPVINVNPAAGGADSLALLQAAITAASNASLYPTQASGYRVVIQLSPGLFKISNSISINNNSGIILRGAGSGTDVASNTTIAYTGTSQIDMIHVDSTATRQTVSNSTHNVVAKVVPAGSYALPLDSVSGYNVGDTILVHRPSPASWIHDIKMDQIPPRADGGAIDQWAPGSKDQYYERKITAIDQTTKSIMLDSPLPNALQKKYGDTSTNGYGATVQKYTFARAKNIGLENLRGDGQLVPTTATDENHANSFITLQDSENVWVRNIASVHQVYAAVEAGTGTKYVTVTNASSASPVSQITGGRRYAFNEEGQYALMQNLTSDSGRHDFVNNSPSRGPNVFLNGTATNANAESGPHQRWSTGTLYDSITTSYQINAYDRGNDGTGHGWAGAQFVIWNSKANRFVVNSPPTAQNWVIGSTGTYAAAGAYTPSYTDSKNSAVTLNVNGTGYTSLYQAQLADRLAHPNQTIREYTVGDYDSYETGDAADTPSVDSDWRTRIASKVPTATLTTLDDTSTGTKAVPLTFIYDLNAASQHVTSGVLTLAMHSTGSGFTSNDKVYIEATAVPVVLGSLSALPTFTTETGLSSIVVTLEFGSAIPLDLSYLQDGQLNLATAGNISLDWANLVVTMEPGAATPEPTAGLLIASGLGAFGLKRRRR